jgi:hypothetical protein
MKIRHVEAVFLRYHDPFFFLSRKAAKPQSRQERQQKGFAALREMSFFSGTTTGSTSSHNLSLFSSAQGEVPSPFGRGVG